MNRDEIKLNDIFVKAKQILNNIGFNTITVKNIKLNSRLKSTYGRYFNYNQTIEISKRHFLLDAEEDVMNTIIHEISHNIHDQLYTDDYNDGHTKEWFDIAKQITNLTRYKITQFVDESVANSSQIQKTLVNIIPKYTHYFKCKCNNQFWITSKFKDYHDIKKRIRCPECIATLKLGIQNNSDGYDVTFIETKLSHNEYRYIDEH